MEQYSSEESYHRLIHINVLWNWLKSELLGVTGYSHFNSQIFFGTIHVVKQIVLTYSQNMMSSFRNRLQTYGMRYFLSLASGNTFIVCTVAKKITITE